MRNLHTDKIVFFRNLTKIGSDENKAIYSIKYYFPLFSYGSTSRYSKQPA